MNLNIESIINGLIINGIYDILKILFGVIFGWIGCKYFNTLKIKGNKNKAFQKGGGNKAEVEGDGNDITQI